LKDKNFISLQSPSSSIQNNLLPEKMAFWNSFVPTLAEPQPTMVPVEPITTPKTPATIAPTAQKEAVADKGEVFSDRVAFYSEHSRQLSHVHFA